MLLFSPDAPAIEAIPFNLGNADPHHEAFGNEWARHVLGGDSDLGGSQAFSACEMLRALQCGEQPSLIYQQHLVGKR